VKSERLVSALLFCLLIALGVLMAGCEEDIEKNDLSISIEDNIVKIENSGDNLIILELPMIETENGNLINLAGDVEEGVAIVTVHSNFYKLGEDVEYIEKIYKSFTITGTALTDGVDVAFIKVLGEVTLPEPSQAKVLQAFGVMLDTMIGYEFQNKRTILLGPRDSVTIVLNSGERIKKVGGNYTVVHLNEEIKGPFRLRREGGLPHCIRNTLSETLKCACNDVCLQPCYPSSITVLCKFSFPTRYSMDPKTYWTFLSAIEKCDSRWLPSGLCYSSLVVVLEKKIDGKWEKYNIKKDIKRLIEKKEYTYPRSELRTTIITELTSKFSELISTPHTIETPEQNAIKRVRDYLDSITNYFEYLNTIFEYWAKYNKELGGEAPSKYTITFKYDIIGARFFYSSEDARKYMSSNSVRGEYIDDALDIIEKLELERDGFCIVIVDYYYSGFNHRESGRYPIVCNEKGDPFWESWQFYEKIKEEIEREIKNLNSIYKK